MSKKEKQQETTIEETNLQLTEMELKNIDLYQAQTNLQIQIKENLQMKEHLLKIDYMNNRNTLRSQQIGVVRSLEEAKANYNKTVAEIEERLGISLKDYGVLDDGVLRELPPQEKNPEKEEG